MRAFGRYSARRCTTLAAVTSALSVLNGREPWPGVPCTISRRQLPPFSPTVTLQRVAGLGRDRHAAALGDDVVALHRVGVMLDQVPGAQESAGLLVGHRQVDQRAARLPVALRQPAHGHRHRRGEVEHVDGAAAPHDAVHQLGAERIALPAGGVHRHDVGVAHQQQRRRVAVAALDPRDQAHASGLRDVALARQARAREVDLQGVHAASPRGRRRGLRCSRSRCG